MKLTEKQKDCPYCRSKRTDDNLEIYQSEDNGYLSINSDGDVEIDEGNLVMEENFYLYQEKLFKFCPMCGRPLGKEVEKYDETEVSKQKGAADDQV